LAHELCFLAKKIRLLSGMPRAIFLGKVYHTSGSKSKRRNSILLNFSKGFVVYGGVNSPQTSPALSISLELVPGESALLRQCPVSFWPVVANC
jgi:hypothetical protein